MHFGFVGIQEGPIDPLGSRSQDAMKPDRVAGHGNLPFDESVKAANRQRTLPVRH